MDEERVVYAQISSATRTGLFVHELAIGRTVTIGALENGDLVPHFFSSRRRHTNFDCDWSSDVCSSDLNSSTTLWPNSIHAKLAVGTRSHLQDLVNVIDLFARIELVHNVVDEFKILVDQIARCNLFLFSEINQLAIQTIARRTPLVFHDQSAPIEAESLISGIQLVQLRNRGLDERRQRNSFIHSHRNIANT